MSHGYNKLTFHEYQRSARHTAVYPTVGHDCTYPILGLVGEAGELANKFKKVFRDHGGIIPPEIAEDISSELGDVLWYTTMIAHELGFDLADIAMANLTKLHDRKKRGMLHGSGDNR